MRHVQWHQVPPVPQARLLVRRKPLLENPYRLQGVRVLRLGQQGRLPVYMPRFRRHRMLTQSSLLRVLVPFAGAGALVGAFARSFGGAGWILALLALSAATTAIIQQTLP